MFTNAIIYRLTALPPLDVAELGIGQQEFVPTTPSQERSSGWSTPRGQEGGALIESVGGQWILRFETETGSVLGATLRKKVDDRCAQIEASTGRKPGKIERRELKEDIVHEMLPMAFPKRAVMNVWIDPVRGLLVLDTSSHARADSAVTALVKSLDIAVAQLNTVQEPAAACAHWLHNAKPPADFAIGRELELKSTDESKAVVRYSKHALDTKEVADHIADGKRPTRLAMEWDDRVSFVLSADLTLRKIKFLEGQPEGKAVDEFDGNVAIATGGLGLLIGNLVGALGGEPVVAL